MVTATFASRTVDIHDIDDLLRVANEVRDHGGSLVIEGDDGMSIEVPSSAASMETSASHAAEAASDDVDFLKSAGAWAGLVDGDDLKSLIHTGRATSRPAVVLDAP